MIFLIWAIAIVGGAVIQTIWSKAAGGLGALPILLIYGVLFAIAGTLTAKVHANRRQKAETELRKQENESGELSSATMSKSGRGILTCTDEAFVYEDSNGNKTEYLYMDLKAMRVEKSNVVLVDSKWEEHKFKVNNPRLWVTKISEIMTKPQSWDGKFQVIQLLRSFVGTEEELKDKLMYMRRKNLITKEFGEVALCEYQTAKKENRKIDEELLENSTSLAVYWYRQGKCMQCGGELEKNMFRKKCKSCGAVDTSQ